MLSWLLPNSSAILYSIAIFFILIMQYRRQSDLASLMLFLCFSLVILLILLQKQLYYFALMYALVYFGGVLIFLFVSQSYIASVNIKTEDAFFRYYRMLLLYPIFWLVMKADNVNIYCINSNYRGQSFWRIEMDVLSIGLMYYQYVAYLYLLVFLLLSFIIVLALSVKVRIKNK